MVAKPKQVRLRMPKIIKDRKIIEDHWQLVHELHELPRQGDILVTLAFWHSHQAHLLKHTGKLGVWIKPDDDVAVIANDLSHFALIAIDFPTFADGRGFSSAYLLKARYGYQGELRAVGEVLRDQMFYMQRVGFNAFAVHPNHSIEDALKSLNDFSDTYQGSVDQPLPHFRRHAHL